VKGAGSAGWLAAVADVPIDVDPATRRGQVQGKTVFGGQAGAASAATPVARPATGFAALVGIARLGDVPEPPGKEGEEISLLNAK